MRTGAGGAGSSTRRVASSLCETDAIVERQKAYEAIAAVYREWGVGRQYDWTPEVVAETERRLAINDADIPDPTAHLADFALQVLDRLGVVEPYDGPGDLRSNIAKPS